MHFASALRDRHQPRPQTPAGAQIGYKLSYLHNWPVRNLEDILHPERSEKLRVWARGGLGEWTRHPETVEIHLLLSGQPKDNAVLTLTQIH